MINRCQARVFLVVSMMNSILKSSAIQTSRAKHRLWEGFLGRCGQTLRNVVSGFAIFLIHLYQATLRPLLMGGCKFCPSCSEYAIGALRQHGPVRGGLLGIRRLVRCHPFSPGGIDLVPPPRDTSKRLDR